MRAPLTGGGSQAKQPIFRIRRNKWSILKFVLILSAAIYLTFYIFSSIFTAPMLDSGQSLGLQTGELASREEADRVKPLGVAEHLPLLDSTSTAKSKHRSFQAATSDSSTAVEHRNQHQSSQQHTGQSATSHDKPSDDHLGVSRKPHRKLGSKSMRLKKEKLDKELKTLLPVVSGWGENGKGVHLTSTKDKEKAAEVFKQGAYNVYVSDRISPNRTLHRVAAQECNEVKYAVDELPNVTVIIIFTNEIFSALVRTIWSVINRTPKRLLREIILVDDFSDKDYLQATLHDYIDVYLNTVPGYEHGDDELVKLVRLPERMGLIKARLKGARMAQGDVLLFLDSHCEATDMWLEPLVQRIKDNRKVFICPVIDIINDKTLDYNAVDPYFFQLGGFDWTGHFTWINRRESDAQREPTHVAKSPTMAGGLFAVDRKYFFEVGSYDEDMQIWGGENLELSFRVWQCGGRVEIHPCSHVGHIFRDFHPYSFNGLDSHGYNTLRTVKVWMDEYSKYFFMSRPDLLNMPSGDLTRRMQLRERLQCKSFQWYLDNVYDKRKFIYDKNVLAYGWVKNKMSGLCIDVLNKHETSGETAGLYLCETMKHPLNVTTNQLFSYSKEKEIRREEGCLTVTEISKNISSNDENDTSGSYHKVILASCEEPDYVSNSHRKESREKHKQQKWRHELAHPKNTKHRLLISEASGECLTAQGSQSQDDLTSTECDRNDPMQYWEFQISTNY